MVELGLNSPRYRPRAYMRRVLTTTTRLDLSLIHVPPIGGDLRGSGSICVEALLSKDPMHRSGVLRASIVSWAPAPSRLGLPVARCEVPWGLALGSGHGPCTMSGHNPAARPRTLRTVCAHLVTGVWAPSAGARITGREACPTSQTIDCLAPWAARCSPARKFSRPPSAHGGYPDSVCQCTPGVGNYSVVKDRLSSSNYRDETVSEPHRAAIIGEPISCSVYIHQPAATVFALDA
jgi:hypothetical protein